MLFLGLYMLHKVISKKTSKNKLIAGISNFFDKHFRKIKASLRLHHPSTKTATVTVAGSNQKKTPEES
jgi:hypothetical protein